MDHFNHFICNVTKYLAKLSSHIVTYELFNWLRHRLMQSSVLFVVFCCSTIPIQWQHEIGAKSEEQKIKKIIMESPVFNDLFIRLQCCAASPVLIIILPHSFLSVCPFVRLSLCGMIAIASSHSPSKSIESNTRFRWPCWCTQSMFLRDLSAPSSDRHLDNHKKLPRLLFRAISFSWIEFVLPGTIDLVAALS